MNRKWFEEGHPIYIDEPIPIEISGDSAVNFQQVRSTGGSNKSSPVERPPSMGARGNIARGPSHEFSGGGLDINVAAFLNKLWNIVNDPSQSDIISWNEDGTSFTIHNATLFAKDVLPAYFKHNNVSSFIRQLNMYGFRKVIQFGDVPQRGSTAAYQDVLEFYHPWFLRDQYDLLRLIKRKVHNVNRMDAKMGREDLVNVSSNLKQISELQTATNQELAEIKHENMQLWAEIENLHQQHQHQQTIVNKLIRFLISLVHNSQGMGFKRRQGRMLSMTGDSSGKRFAQPLSIAGGTSSPGPSKIRRVVEPEYSGRGAEMDLPTQRRVWKGRKGRNGVQMRQGKTVPLELESRTSSTLPPKSAVRLEQIKPDTSQQALALRPDNRKSFERQRSHEIETQLLNTQTSLDSLQNLMSGNFNIDASLLNDLFDPTNQLIDPISASDSQEPADARDTQTRNNLVANQNQDLGILELDFDCNYLLNRENLLNTLESEYTAHPSEMEVDLPEDWKNLQLVEYVPMTSEQAYTVPTKGLYGCQSIHEPRVVAAPYENELTKFPIISSPSPQDATYDSIPTPECIETLPDSLPALSYLDDVDTTFDTPINTPIIDHQPSFVNNTSTSASSVTPSDITSTLLPDHSPDRLSAQFSPLFSSPLPSASTTAQQSLSTDHLFLEDQDKQLQKEVLMPPPSLPCDLDEILNEG